MSKSEEFKRLMEISSSNRVVLLTNHYQIVGQVYDCEECNREAYINLTNASLCLIMMFMKIRPVTNTQALTMTGFM